MSDRNELEPNPYLDVDLSFPRSHQESVCVGRIKSRSEDFYVEELMDPELSGEGEHIWLWVEKIDQNTEYVAKQIARFACVRAMDVGLSGQKDRWAVTRQWFSVYMGNKPEPNWNECDIEGVTLLKVERHSKKLRRGEHYANHFKIRIRGVESTDLLLPLLERLKLHGFPNYYGMQRFGRQGANLSRAASWFLGKLKVSRSQKSFYLSATRSYLFNLNLAKLVGSAGLDWSEISSLEGPLYGDPSESVLPLNDQETEILKRHPVLAKGIHQNRMKLERRPYVVVPKNMSWTVCNERNKDGNEYEVELCFDLPTGVFATSLLDEICDFELGLGQTS